MRIEKILDDFKHGKISEKEMIRVIRDLPFEDMGFAKIDHHRKLRKSFPEVVFCEGKTHEQASAIIKKLSEKNDDVLATRADKKLHEKLKKLVKNASYNEKARIISIQKPGKKERKGKVLIITGGTADMPVAEEAAVTAEVMGCNVERIYDVGVAGIHRLLAFRKDLFEADVVIAVAGMEGALPSVVGGLAKGLVIAVPTSIGYGASFNGLSALLSMMNCCAPGVVVVNIDNGFGAGYAAAIVIKSMGKR